MKSNNYLGIWMDHSAANLIDINDSKKCHDISSEFTFDIKEEALNKGETLMNNKQQQMQDAYYKNIGDVIKKYDHVLLFGPTDAKKELHNFLGKDLHFKDIQIDIEAADKMSDNEKVAFVKKHFSS